MIALQLINKHPVHCTVSRDTLLPAKRVEYTENF